MCKLLVLFYKPVLLDPHNPCCLLEADAFFGRRFEIFPPYITSLPDWNQQITLYKLNNFRHLRSWFGPVTAQTKHVCRIHTRESVIYALVQPVLRFSA